jgi:uncharacterized protein
VYADHLIRPWLEPLRAALPRLTVLDAHTHTGANDPDGYSCTAAQLIGALELAGARSVVFSMQEPDGYPAANDRVLAEAAASDGRLTPFCRLDPREDPIAEAERCLAAGARGIKLHPRAERFALADPEVAPIFALANERRLAVVVHAGRGIPALGRHALELAARYPHARIVLAHAGISDLSWTWRHAEAHPNLFYDTAWWNPADLLALFALVPPGRILLASDAPYGTPLLGVVLTLRCAMQVGLSAEQLRGVAGAQAERLLAGDAPLELGAAPGAGNVGADVLLDRTYSMLVTALGRMLVGDDGAEFLGLARLACEVGEDAPQAPACRSIAALLGRYERLLGQAGAGGRAAPGSHLIVIAACVARTPAVALPPEPEPVTVGERPG